MPLLKKGMPALDGTRSKARDCGGLYEAGADATRVSVRVPGGAKVEAVEVGLERSLSTTRFRKSAMFEGIYVSFPPLKAPGKLVTPVIR